MFFTKASIGIRLVLTVFVTLLFLLDFNGSVLAGDDLNLPQQKIYPGNNYYKIKRLWEKIVGAFVLREAPRLKYHTDLLAKRVSELKYVVVDVNDLDEVEHSSQRVSYEAGMLQEDFATFSDKSMKEEVVILFKKYKEFLPQLRDKYPANSSNWLLIQQNIDTFKELSRKLQEE